MLTIERILVATDFSEASDAALTYGRELAGRFGARLHVLNVVKDIYFDTLGARNYVGTAPDLQQQIEEGARAQLDELVNRDRGGPPGNSTLPFHDTAAPLTRKRLHRAAARQDPQ